VRWPRRESSEKKEKGEVFSEYTVPFMGLGGSSSQDAGGTMTWQGLNWFGKRRD